MQGSGFGRLSASAAANSTRHAGGSMIASVFHVILYQPEIPPNTGNVIRLCANVGATLHLVHPLGFEHRRAARAPRGPRLCTSSRACASTQTCCCLAALGGAALVRDHDARHALRLRQRALRGRRRVRVRPGDARPAATSARDLSAASSACAFRCAPGNRSLNLSNAAAVVVYEAWRQLRFAVRPTPIPHSGSSVDRLHDRILAARGSRPRETTRYSCSPIGIATPSRAATRCTARAPL